jgi:hypothetical protein
MQSILFTGEVHDAPGGINSLHILFWKRGQGVDLGDSGSKSDDRLIDLLDHLN